MLKRPGAVLVRLAVGLSVGIAILSGCSAKQEASTSLPAPTSKAAPTTAALPPLGPPDFPVPAAARTKDAAGAEAFLRYYVELINRQSEIPRGRWIRTLGPACQECLRIARSFDKTASEGGRYLGGRMTINATVPPRGSGDSLQFSFTVRAEDEQRVDRAGKVLERAAFAGNLGSAMYLTWSTVHRSWLVEALNFG